MPIEIKELNIRINVNQNQPEQDGPPQHATAQTPGNNNKEEIIAECIEQVMELLKNKMDR
jgi:hypothetical protein